MLSLLEDLDQLNVKRESWSRFYPELKTYILTVCWIKSSLTLKVSIGMRKKPRIDESSQRTWSMTLGCKTLLIFKTTKQPPSLRWHLCILDELCWCLISLQNNQEVHISKLQPEPFSKILKETQTVSSAQTKRDPCVAANLGSALTKKTLSRSPPWVAQSHWWVIWSYSALKRWGKLWLWLAGWNIWTHFQ